MCSNTCNSRVSFSLHRNLFGAHVHVFHSTAKTNVHHADPRTQPIQYRYHKRPKMDLPFANIYTSTYTYVYGSTIIRTTAPNRRTHVALHAVRHMVAPETPRSFISSMWFTTDGGTRALPVWMVGDDRERFAPDLVGALTPPH